jgi:hypothetical protein
MRNDTVRRVYLGRKIEAVPRRELAGARKPPLLELEQVGVLYAKAQALDGVSLRVREGEFVSIVGSGKPRPSPCCSANRKNGYRVSLKPRLLHPSRSASRGERRA